MAVTAALVFAVAAGGTLAAQRVQSGVLSLGLNASALDIEWKGDSTTADSDSEIIKINDTNIMPGDTYTFDGENYVVQNVQTKDNAVATNLPAYIRVTVTKYWVKDEDASTVKDTSFDKDVAADANLLTLTCNSENGWKEVTSPFGNRTKGETQMFYYLKPVPSGEATTELLKSLELSTAAGNDYTDRQIYLEAEADAVQYVPGDNELNEQAILSAWGVKATLNADGSISAISN